MLSIRKELREEIQDKLGLTTYFVQPPINVDIALPIVILEEATNSTYFRSESIEVANLSYTLSIYTDQPAQLFDLMEQLDDLMYSLGLKRTFTSGDMCLDRLWCKSITYVCKATHDASGIIKITQ